MHFFTSFNFFASRDRTIGWQGSTDDQQFSYGTSVLTAAKKVDHWDVSSSCGVDILGQRCTENMYAHLASEADYVIICVGEEGELVVPLLSFALIGESFSFAQV